MLFADFSKLSEELLLKECGAVLASRDDVRRAKRLDWEEAYGVTLQTRVPGYVVKLYARTRSGDVFEVKNGGRRLPTESRKAVFLCLAGNAVQFLLTKTEQVR